MRIEPENGIVMLMRGDTLVLPIHINIGTKLAPRYKSLQPSERLYFGLMEPHQAFEDAVLKKVLDHTSDTDGDGNPLLVLNPKDTEKLSVGKYYYMIKLRTIDTFGQEVVRTIVSPTLFWLEGNNVAPQEDAYYTKGKYNIDRVEIDGGEVGDDQHIIFEGGEII